jgi:hypothetical protein
VQRSSLEARLIGTGKCGWLEVGHTSADIWRHEKQPDTFFRRATFSFLFVLDGTRLLTSCSAGHVIDVLQCRSTRAIQGSCRNAMVPKSHQMAMSRLTNTASQGTRCHTRQPWRLRGSSTQEQGQQIHSSSMQLRRYPRWRATAESCSQRRILA